MMNKRQLGLALCLASLAPLAGAAAGQGPKPDQASPAGRAPGGNGQQPPSRSGPSQPQGADFYVVNATQVPMVSVQASRTEERGWGSNRLGAGAVVAPGGRFLVQNPNDGRCSFDVRVVFQGGNEAERRNIDACRLAELPFNVAGAPPANRDSGGGTAAATTAPDGMIHVTIVNAFRRTLTELRASPPSESGFGDDRLGRDVISSQGRWELRLPANQGCQWDMAASFESGGSQRIMNVNLCTAGTVTFTGPQPGTVRSYGTGFRISAAGHIMTNNHVVNGCGSVAIQAKDRRMPLRLVGQDPITDLAVLQQPDIVAPFLSFRSPQSPVRLAERAISIGYPIPTELGSSGGVGERIVTEGIVNALTGMRSDATRYQLQTPIQPGNSGGPIFDRSGLVIGVAVSGLDRAGDRIMQNVNFAISPVVAERFAESLGVQLRYEPSGQDLSTEDVMNRNGDRVLQLVCLN